MLLNNIISQDFVAADLLQDNGDYDPQFDSHLSVSKWYDNHSEKFYQERELLIQSLVEEYYSMKRTVKTY